MTTIRKIVTSKIDGSDANNTTDDEIRPYGETAVYLDTSTSPNKPTLMMFDGVRTHLKSKVLAPGRVYGSDADAGDGSGADTIKLIPDAEILANGSNQYLIIDPTGGDPGHIHIRAGGPQDASAADLYLGGGLTCVSVSDTSDSVIIRTTNLGDPNITMNWTFDNQGYLYLPGVGSNRIGESEPGMVLSSDIGIALVADSLGNSKTLIFDVNGKLKLNNTEINAISSQTQIGTIITVPLNAAGDTVDYTGGASLIEVPTNEDTSQVTAGWVITFNGGARRTVSFTAVGGGYTSIYYSEASPGGTLYPLTIESADYAAAVTGTISLTPNPNVESPKTWTFSENATLTFPMPVNNDVPSIEFPIPDIVDGTAGILLDPSGLVVRILDSGWTFSPLLTGEGTVPAKITFPDGTQQTTAWAGGRVVDAPNFSTGAEGDIAGDIAFSNDYFYYCIADYTDSQSTIWKRVGWSADTW